MESKIQSSIIKYLESIEYLVIKTIRLNKNGYPDLFCFKNGKTIFIEVKDISRKADKLQLFRHQELRNKGFEVFIFNNLIDCKSMIKD